MTQNRIKTIRHLLLLLIVIVPLFSLGLSNHGLWSADEPRVAEIGREMALSGNWAVPTLNQKPFLEEPPLYYGALALTFKAFGTSDKVARIPSALFACATVLVLFFLANSLFGPRVGLLSGFILATAGEFFRVAHWIVVDSALTFFVMSAMFLFITAYLSENGRRKLLCYTLLYVACTLGFYTKGFIGVVIPGLGILTFLLAERNLKEIVAMRLWLGVIVFVAMTVPWFIALWHQGGVEYLKVFLLHNHLQRFLPASMAGTLSESASGHHNPFYYYLTEFPIGFLPWSILLIPVLIHAFSKDSGEKNASAKGVLLAKCWFFAGIVFLSVASTKRTLYLMPLFAPISVLTALYIGSTVAASFLSKISRVFLWVLDVLLLVIGLGLTPVYFYVKKAYPLTLPPGFFAWVLVISVLVTALALAGAFYLQRRNLARYWISVNLPVVLVLIFTLTAIVPIVDTHKSFVPFCRQIAALVPADQPLYAYKADETLRGAVPFYTRRFVIEREEIGKNLLTQKEPLFIMVRDRRGTLEAELTSHGTLHPVVRQMMGSDRTLLLFSNKPVLKTIVIGDAFKKVKKDRSDRRGP
jgi:4-amino-4-deoxy-L-arabinose transferase-like glycosyltransferase